jgi:hypothetical protein
MRKWGNRRRKQTRSTAAGSCHCVISELRLPLPVLGQSNDFLMQRNGWTFGPLTDLNNMKVGSQFCKSISEQFALLQP